MTMTTELYWLTLTTMMTGLLWMPYILQLIGQMGFFGAMWDPTGAHPHEADWALRAKRAHYNAVENLVVFAPLTLLVGALGIGDGLTVTAAILYFWVRLAQYVIHVFALPVLRTLMFMAGVGCQGIMGLRLLGLL